MATANLVAMITSPTVLPIWKQHAAFFRGADELLAWLARKPEIERRCVTRAQEAPGGRVSEKRLPKWQSPQNARRLSEVGF